MRTRTALAAVVPLMLGLCSGRAAWADAPRADPPVVKEAPRIAESDRWFIVAPPVGTDLKVNLHIAIKKNDKAESPVRVTYEVNAFLEGQMKVPMRATIENLCLNDEWLSPVKVSMTYTGDPNNRPPPAMSAAITRPDPISTAGKMKVEGADAKDMPEKEIKEHTVLFFTPLEMALRMPFEKDKKVAFAVLDFKDLSAQDGILSYAGEEEIEVKGKKQTAHKFVWTVGDAEKTSTFWLDAKHQLIRAVIDGATMTPATKEEAIKAVEGEKAPEPAK